MSDLTLIKEKILKLDSVFGIISEKNDLLKKERDAHRKLFEDHQQRCSQNEELQNDLDTYKRLFEEHSNMYVEAKKTADRLRPELDKLRSEHAGCGDAIAERKKRETALNRKLRSERERSHALKGDLAKANGESKVRILFHEREAQSARDECGRLAERNRELIETNENLRGIVLECSRRPPESRDAGEQCGLLEGGEKELADASVQCDLIKYKNEKVSELEAKIEFSKQEVDLLGFSENEVHSDDEKFYDFKLNADLIDDDEVFGMLSDVTNYPEPVGPINSPLTIHPVKSFASVQVQTTRTTVTCATQTVTNSSHRKTQTVCSQNNSETQTWCERSDGTTQTRFELKTSGTQTIINRINSERQTDDSLKGVSTNLENCTEIANSFTNNCNVSTEVGNQTDDNLKDVSYNLGNCNRVINNTSGNCNENTEVENQTVEVSNNMENCTKTTNTLVINNTENCYESTEVESQTNDMSNNIGNCTETTDSLVIINTSGNRNESIEMDANGTVKLNARNDNEGEEKFMNNNEIVNANVASNIELSSNNKNSSDDEEQTYTENCNSKVQKDSRKANKIPNRKKPPGKSAGKKPRKALVCSVEVQTESFEVSKREKIVDKRRRRSSSRPKITVRKAIEVLKRSKIDVTLKGGRLIKYNKQIAVRTKDQIQRRMEKNIMDKIIGYINENIGAGLSRSALQRIGLNRSGAESTTTGQSDTDSCSRGYAKKLGQKSEFDSGYTSDHDFLETGKSSFGLANDGARSSEEVRSVSRPSSSTSEKVRSTASVSGMNSSYNVSLKKAEDVKDCITAGDSLKTREIMGLNNEELAINAGDLLKNVQTRELMGLNDIIVKRAKLNSTSLHNIRDDSTGIVSGDDSMVSEENEEPAIYKIIKGAELKATSLHDIRDDSVGIISKVSEGTETTFASRKREAELIVETLAKKKRECLFGGGVKNGVASLKGEDDGALPGNPDDGGSLKSVFDVDESRALPGNPDDAGSVKSMFDVDESSSDFVADILKEMKSVPLLLSPVKDAAGKKRAQSCADDKNTKEIARKRKCPQTQTTNTLTSSDHRVFELTIPDTNATSPHSECKDGTGSTNNRPDVLIKTDIVNDKSKPTDKISEDKICPLCRTTIKFDDGCCSICISRETLKETGFKNNGVVGSTADGTIYIENEDNLMELLDSMENDNSADLKNGVENNWKLENIAKSNGGLENDSKINTNLKSDVISKSNININDELETNSNLKNGMENHGNRESISKPDTDIKGVAGDLRNTENIAGTNTNLKDDGGKPLLIKTNILSQLTLNNEIESDELQIKDKDLVYNHSAAIREAKSAQTLVETAIEEKPVVANEQSHSSLASTKDASLEEVDETNIKRGLMVKINEITTDVLKGQKKKAAGKKKNAIGKKYSEKKKTYEPWDAIKESFKNAVRFKGVEEYTVAALTIFKTIDTGKLISYLLHEVIEDECEIMKGLSPFEPFLSITQKTVLGLLLHLERSHDPDIVEKFMTACEHRLLFSEKDPLAVEHIVRLYASICKMRKLKHRLRRLIFDGLFFMGDSVLPLIYYTLTAWIQVLKRNGSNNDELHDPFAKILVQVVHTKSINLPEYCLCVLKNLLQVYYRYPKERYHENNLFKEFLEKYMCTLSGKYAFVILILCKNSKVSWVIRQMALIEELILIVKDEETIEALKELKGKIQRQIGIKKVQ